MRSLFPPRSDPSPAAPSHPPRRMSLECLEGRELLTTISVGDASMNEIGSPSDFVAAGSGGLDRPDGMALGPDGNVYVASTAATQCAPLQRHHRPAASARSSPRAPAGSPTVYGLAFGPRRQPLRRQRRHDQVFRYNGTTGAFMNISSRAGSGGLDTPDGDRRSGQTATSMSAAVDTNSVHALSGPSERLAREPAAVARPDRGDVRRAGQWRPVQPF